MTLHTCLYKLQLALYIICERIVLLPLPHKKKKGFVQSFQSATSQDTFREDKAIGTLPIPLNVVLTPKITLEGDKSKNGIVRHRCGIIIYSISQVSCITNWTKYSKRHARRPAKMISFVLYPPSLKVPPTKSPQPLLFNRLSSEHVEREQQSKESHSPKIAIQ